jgi:hypothetical protein
VSQTPLETPRRTLVFPAFALPIIRTRKRIFGIRGLGGWLDRLDIGATMFGGVDLVPDRSRDQFIAVQCSCSYNHATGACRAAGILNAFPFLRTFSFVQTASVSCIIKCDIGASAFRLLVRIPLIPLSTRKTKTPFESSQKSSACSTKSP